MTQAEPIRFSLHSIWSFDRTNQLKSMVCKFMSCRAIIASVLSCSMVAGLVKLRTTSPRVSFHSRVESKKKLGGESAVAAVIPWQSSWPNTVTADAEVSEESQPVLLLCSTTSSSSLHQKQLQAQHKMLCSELTEKVATRSIIETSL